MRPRILARQGTRSSPRSGGGSLTPESTDEVGPGVGKWSEERPSRCLLFSLVFGVGRVSILDVVGFTGRLVPRGKA